MYKLDTQRRRWLVGGVALAATAAGAWLGWQREQGGAGRDEAEEAFWQLDLQQPDGASLHMASMRGTPLLVNFWATWCPPCVRELPMLNHFSQAQSARGAQGVRVLGIAVDQVANVNRWLAREPLGFTVALAGAGGVGLTRSLGNTNGGLPFTLLFDAHGHVLQRKIGELSEQDLQEWATFV